MCMNTKEERNVRREEKNSIQLIGRYIFRTDHPNRNVGHANTEFVDESERER